MSEWWTPVQAGWIGGIGGSAVGVVGAVVGGLSGYLVPRGKCKGLVLGLMVAGVCAGLAALVTGIVAVSIDQPYHVWYPLALLGTIPTLVLGPMVPVVMMRYRQAEARRLEAEELRRSSAAG